MTELTVTREQVRAARAEVTALKAIGVEPDPIVVRLAAVVMEGEESMSASRGATKEAEQARGAGRQELNAGRAGHRLNELETDAAVERAIKSAEELAEREAAEHAADLGRELDPDPYPDRGIEGPGMGGRF